MKKALKSDGVLCCQGKCSINKDHTTYAAVDQIRVEVIIIVGVVNVSQFSVVKKNSCYTPANTYLEFFVTSVTHVPSQKLSRGPVCCKIELISGTCTCCHSHLLAIVKSSSNP